MSGDRSPQRFTTIGTSSLQIRVKTPNASRSPSRSPEVSSFTRSRSARYSRKDYEGKDLNTLAPPTTSRFTTRSLSPRPDRGQQGCSRPPPPSPNPSGRTGGGCSPLLPTRAPTPPLMLTSTLTLKTVGPARLGNPDAKTYSRQSTLGASSPLSVKARSVSPSPSRLGVGGSSSGFATSDRSRLTKPSLSARSVSPSPNREGGVSPRSFATNLSERVTLGLMKNPTTPTNNNTIFKDIKSNKPTLTLTPPCTRKLVSDVSSKSHSLVPGSPRTSSVSVERNNNHSKSLPMTPPSVRKVGTTSPHPYTAGPTDPLLAYPFCPYKLDDDEGRERPFTETLIFYTPICPDRQKYFYHPSRLLGNLRLLASFCSGISSIYSFFSNQSLQLIFCIR